MRSFVTGCCRRGGFYILALATTTRGSTRGRGDRVNDGNLVDSLRETCAVYETSPVWLIRYRDSKIYGMSGRRIIRSSDHLDWKMDFAEGNISSLLFFYIFSIKFNKYLTLYHAIFDTLFLCRKYFILTFLLIPSNQIKRYPKFLKRLNMSLFLLGIRRRKAREVSYPLHFHLLSIRIGRHTFLNIISTGGRDSWAHGRVRAGWRARRAPTKRLSVSSTYALLFC